MAATSSPRLVLSISLNTAAGEAEVRCLLQKGSERLDDWPFSAAKMGLPDTLDSRKARYQGYSFVIPAEVVAAMTPWVQAELAPGQPLWLHLERPSGYLRLVPWEQLLQPLLGVAMLRLPDVESELPRETPRTLDVVLCASAPQAKEPVSIAEYLRRIADRILDVVSRRTTLHVFTDGKVHPQLKQLWEGQGKLGSSIRLYAPETAAPYSVPDPTLRIEDAADRIQSPWLLWMRDSLQGRSVDVAHFLCHGYVWLDRGALAFAESPLKNDDRRLARFVGDVELSTFMTQVGAWSTTFSSPERNFSELGLRLLADKVAQSRPGPVLHQELRLDSDCAALAKAYRFLYHPDGAPPPASPSLLLYCQPSRLETPEARDVSRKRSFATRAATPAAKELEAVFAGKDNVRGWIAAAERSVEQCNFRLQTRGADEVDPVQETLRQIQEIVARAAAKEAGQP